MTQDWRKSILGSLGYRATPQNLQFLDAWQRHEGGDTHNSAKFNWLNTTHGPGVPINSVGVKRFPSYQAGIRALAETLQNGRYQDILDGLASGDPYKANVSAGLQTWVSGRPDGNPSYAASIVGGAQPKPLKRRAVATATRAKTQIRQLQTVSPNPQWDVAMKLIFEDDPEMGQLLAQMDDKTAQASGFVSPGGSLKPVAVDPTTVPSAVSRLTQVAATQLGKPYVFGSGPSTESFDCSDLIQWAYKQIGIDIPRTTFDQIHVGRSVKGKPLQPGDLVFPTNHHVVMYVGGGKVIAAPHTGTVVQYQPLSRFGSPVDVRRIV